MSGGRPEERGGLIRGAFVLTLIGVALGVAYNASGRASRPQFGLEWIGVDRFAGLPTLEAVELPADGHASSGSFTTNVSDPMAIGGGAAAASNVPEVPDLDRPMQIQLDAAQQFFDAQAAWFVDARDEADCLRGRISGAICLPYDEVLQHPDRVSLLGSDGRPIIVYCGGGLCEVSLSVARELIEAGKTKVLVYMGGFDLWSEAGHPVAAWSGEGAP